MRRINQYSQTDAMIIDVMAKEMQAGDMQDKGAQHKVYNLAAGDPDLDICDSIKKAYRETDLDVTHNYCSAQGLTELRGKIWHDPEQVIVADGAKQLIYESLATVARPGDTVVFVGPIWTSYIKMCEILGVGYRLICGDSDEAFIPTIQKIEDAMMPDVCAIVLNNPNNPAGYVLTGEYLDAIAGLAERHDVWIIADEIYKDLAQVPVKSLRGKERAIVIDGFSKSFNLTGWRMGYAIADARVIGAMTALQSQLSGPPSTIIQDILIRGWDEKKESGYKDYAERIDVLCRIDKFRKHRPQAGFYFYLPIDEKWESSMALCEYMIREHRIAITPGDGYGVPRTVRISVASTSAADLSEIVDRLAEV